MKILMVHPHDLFSPMEPWTIRIVKFAEELTRNGHQVRLAHFPLQDHAGSGLSGFEIISLIRKISPRSMASNVKTLLALSRWADVVHLQKSHFYCALPVALAAYWADKPLHYDWDDWEEEIFYASVPSKGLSTYVTGFSFALMERCLPRLADSVSVASQHLKCLTLERGACADKLFMTPVGADLALFGCGNAGGEVRKRYAADNELLVMYHGQLHSCQYVRIFLESIKIIADQRSGLAIKFMVVGDGDQLNTLKKEADGLGVSSRVVFTGFVPHFEIPRYVVTADICVAPFADNRVTKCKSPLKIAEYLAAGKSIVASRVGEVQNMIADAGILVEPDSPEALAKGILTLVDDAGLRKRLSLAARQRAESLYNWRHSAGQLEKAYANIVG